MTPEEKERALALVDGLMYWTRAGTGAVRVSRPDACRAVVTALREAEERGAAREREACALLAETFDDYCDIPCRTADVIAERIRARGEEGGGGE